MLQKNSRYYNQPDTSAIDARGRKMRSKAPRELPETPGTFQHVVEDRDRLDHLAYRYYKKPSLWWRICDGNPQFKSPLEMLGKDAVRTARVPITCQAAPPWRELLAGLRALIGMEKIRLLETPRIVPEERDLNGRQVTVNAEHYDRFLEITFNSANLSMNEILETIQKLEGVRTGEPELQERLGSKITIPPLQQ